MLSAKHTHVLMTLLVTTALAMSTDRDPPPSLGAEPSLLDALAMEEVLANDFATNQLLGDDLSTRSPPETTHATPSDLSTLESDRRISDITEQLSATDCQSLLLRLYEMNEAGFDAYSLSPEDVRIMRERLEAAGSRPTEQPVVAVLGCTGTGKSTLANLLAGSQQQGGDALFPTGRLWDSKTLMANAQEIDWLGERDSKIGKVIVIDTPGLGDAREDDETGRNDADTRNLRSIAHTIRNISRVYGGISEFVIVIGGDSPRFVDTLQHSIRKYCQMFVESQPGRTVQDWLKHVTLVFNYKVADGGTKGPHARRPCTVGAVVKGTKGTWKNCRCKKHDFQRQLASLLETERYNVACYFMDCNDLADSREQLNEFTDVCLKSKFDCDNIKAPLGLVCEHRAEIDAQQEVLDRAQTQERLSRAAERVHMDTTEVHLQTQRQAELDIVEALESIVLGESRAHAARAASRRPDPVDHAAICMTKCCNINDLPQEQQGWVAGCDKDTNPYGELHGLKRKGEKIYNDNGQEDPRGRWDARGDHYWLESGMRTPRSWKELTPWEEETNKEIDKEKKIKKWGWLLFALIPPLGGGIALLREIDNDCNPGMIYEQPTADRERRRLYVRAYDDLVKRIKAGEHIEEIERIGHTGKGPIVGAAEFSMPGAYRGIIGSEPNFRSNVSTSKSK